MIVALLLTALIGYLLGSLPFGYLVARAKGVNIFEVGSKNPGATNVRRVLGAGPGNLVFALDALKGAAATAAPLLWLRLGGGGGAGEPLPLMVAGLAGALLGHSFSCFTRFRGGKGVATGAGGFLVLFPLGVLAAAATWGLTVLLTRYVSLGSMLAAVALTVAAWALHQPQLLVGLCAAVTLFVILRHRTNIARLAAGTESKVGQKPANPPAA
ncbi:MAG: glycerol-3-phosphate 1-O-acyltransferase PlsY [Verrucomicrobia bacterium]|nr:glycerol-3-phosphate 1-O-acyltransferase PlsY [Verrucomicrobiota bacterium]